MSVSVANGIYPASESDRETNPGASLANYKIVHFGDVVYNSMRMWQGAVDASRYDGIVSPAYVVARPNSEVYARFFARLLRQPMLLKQYQQVSQGNSKDTQVLKFDDFASIGISMPASENEQRQIGGFFDRLDSLITLHQRKLDQEIHARQDVCIGVFMAIITLFHGSPHESVTPEYGLGNDKHDYGRGFYLTKSVELAREWAVCRPDESNGWVHQYELDMNGLRILDFQEHSVLAWLAELMKHRDAADSKRYRVLAAKFIAQYGIDTSGYDIIKGWRANASYFYIAKEFVRDNVDVDILEELLSLGGLGIQYCVKTEKAYGQLREVKDGLLSVSYSEFNDKYNQRDVEARQNMRDLIDSDANTVTNVFSTLL